MKNWSGLVSWNPAIICKPKQKEEIIAIVQNAVNGNNKIRVIGSGHSFTPLSVTNDILISLENYQGIVKVEKLSKQVTIKSGTQLRLLNLLLDIEGLALENMGDVDVQTMAGAISTGTHGTGTEFGNLSTQVCKIEFINGQGSLVSCSESENVEIFKAAQVSLGSFGIITEITIQCIDSYVLELKVSKEAIDKVLSALPEVNKVNRNFEFYWFPNTKWAMTKKINEVDRPPRKYPVNDYVQEMVFENYAFKMVCELSYHVPSMTHVLSRFSANTVSTYSKTKKSFELYATRRLVRFNEMEYNVPIEAYLDLKKDIIKWMLKYNKDVLFPIENRFVKKDDIYLSPAYNRDSAYIAIHMYYKASHMDYFNGIEQIFKAYGGRPHWGKMHTLSKSDFVSLYPMFDAFNSLRNKNDPQGIFLSSYLSTIFND